MNQKNEETLSQDHIKTLRGVDDEPNFSAPRFLNAAIACIADRGREYDPAQSAERSMPAIVRLFEARTGVKLTEVQGWEFMACLKAVRAQTAKPLHADSLIDLIAYEALAAEARARKVMP
jgi:hypothetical protein